MKAFNFEEFNKDGNKFIALTFTFDSENGLKIEEKEKTVSIRPQVSPADGCDFNADGSSCSSKNFFEVSGTPDINDIFFNHYQNHALRLYTYVLPENVNIAKADISMDIEDFIKSELKKRIEADSKVLEMIV